MANESHPEFNDSEINSRFFDQMAAESSLARDTLDSLPIQVALFRKHRHGRWHAFISADTMPIGLVAAWRKKKLMEKVEFEITTFKTILKSLDSM